MSIGAGRPQNSKTPVWRSKPAAKVRAYRFLMPNHVHLLIAEAANWLVTFSFITSFRLLNFYAAKLRIISDYYSP